MIEHINRMLTEFDNPVDKWLALKELKDEIEVKLKALSSEVMEAIDIGEDHGMVSKGKKTTIKPKDSMVKFLEDRDLLRLVKKDEIDMSKINQLVEAGVLDEDELSEHLDKKESAFIKKTRKK